MKRKTYAVVIKPLDEDDGGGFIATVPDLPGCVGDGETEAEALANVQSALEEWIDAAMDEGREIPKPGAAEFRQRLPRTLHAELTEVARSEGVSLNQYITMELSRAVERRHGGVPSINSETTKGKPVPGKQPKRRGQGRAKEPELA